MLVPSMGQVTINIPSPVPSLNVVRSADRTMRANIERGLGAGPNEMAGIVGFKGIIF